MAERSGALGAEAQQSAINAEAVLAGAIYKIGTDQKVAARVYCEAKNWAGNNKAYLAGRFSAGAAISAVSGIGFYGGVALTTFAAMGDALNSIENGMTNPEQIICGALGGRE